MLDGVREDVRRVEAELAKKSVQPPQPERDYPEYHHPANPVVVGPMALSGAITAVGGYGGYYTYLGDGRGMYEVPGVGRVYGSASYIKARGGDFLRNKGRFWKACK